ncbi:MAG TPA: NADH-quinone oxidoreductase subunit N [Gemmatimonadales bacterium]|nr:NADH-quinone oxidoreductase subunit N [Gemmatimonadales bacterium]
MTPVDLTSPGGVAWALIPEIVLTLWALVVLLVLSWRHRTAADSRLAGWLGLVGVLTTAAAVGYQAVVGARPAGLPFMVALDPFRYAANFLFLASAAATILLSLRYVERERLLAPEYYCLILLATAGMMFMGGAEDLIVLFLGLEVMSVPVYVLAGYNRASRFSAEAALKYFLIGAFASAFLLYGIALTYGAMGTTSLPLIGVQVAGGPISLMGKLGLALLLVGFAFKVSAVPFHMWAPDVYDGAPTPITGLMASGVKAAGFVALARVLLEAFPQAATQWQPIVAFIAIATMAVGNLVALAQRSLKRMLAYSSIGHAGYLLVAIWPGTGLAAGAMLFYLVAYLLTTLASFGLLTAVGSGGERDVTLDDLAGLGQERPWLALGLGVCMLSLLGFPGTLGFIGKWHIFTAAVAEGQVILAVALALASAVSAGYYLPVIMAMYMRPAPAGGIQLPAFSRLAAVTVAVAVVAILLFGVWPRELLDLAQDSVSGLLRPVSAVARW